MATTTWRQRMESSLLWIGMFLETRPGLSTVLFSLCVMAAVALGVVLSLYIQSGIQYDYAYEERVRETVRAMVKPEFLVNEGGQ